MRRNPWLGIVAGLGAVTLTLAGCGSSDGSTDDGGAGGNGGLSTLKLWYHGAGNDAERTVVEQQIADFNASQEDYEVVLESFPQASYNDSVVAAAVAGDLPCLLDMDGPIVPNWAWGGYVQPIEVDQAILDTWLPSAMGYYQDDLYAIGYWDAAIGMYARQSVLDTYDIRIPTSDDPWSGEEFEAILQTITEGGEFDYALDLGVNDVSEWYPYAFSPQLQSFGGDLIDRDTYLTAKGALNGPEALEWGNWWQGLFEKGYASTTEQDGNPEFLEGRVALQLNGNWGGVQALEEFGDDMLFLPMPDFGEGPVIGGQSWMFGISATCEHPEGANAYINFSLKDEYVADFTTALGLIPTTEAAAAMTEYYQPGGALEPFKEYSERFALIRPPTPAYSVISSVFTKAAEDIKNGADVKATLDQAVAEIDADIAANDGYGN
ncbi:extracellular solute-binding protein [Actinotalea sp. K2]|uniref:sugar ABC transporter substrate-binding protein n=1 Tax=Actinotalea sp. K2 TaxID=2939438 RepID=UPI00201736A7|nr:extracellular solute-binding protein [Actinotalea sp. K2]MCL3861054.1 extracellular solute-binding protein [Actinotalea sp. K2]